MNPTAAEITTRTSTGHGRPSLRQALKGAFWSKRALTLGSPIVAALLLSFVNVSPALPKFYVDAFPVSEIRPRFVVAVWLAAAVLMSFLFSWGTFGNIMELAKRAPSSLRGENAEAKAFWKWLKYVGRTSQAMLVSFLLLLVFAICPGIANPYVSTDTMQYLTILITGIPLVSLITYADYAMYRAYQSFERCPFGGEEKEDCERMREALGDAGRMLVYVDVPILIGLVPVTALKLYWHFHGEGLEPLYVLGFTGGAIAMHLILGNLISLLFEYLDRNSILPREN